MNIRRSLGGTFAGVLLCLAGTAIADPIEDKGQLDDSLVVGFVNTPRLIKGQDERETAVTLRRLNERLKDMAEQVRIDVVLQEAAYASPKLDITEEIGNTSAVPAHASLNERLRLHTLAFIDTQRLLDGKQGDEAQQLLQELNAKLPEFCRRLDLDLVLQRAAYIDSTIDVTSEMKTFASGNEPDWSSVRLRLHSKRPRLGVVSTARLEQQAGFFRSAYFKKATSVLPEVAKESGVTVILQDAVYFLPATDLTEAVSRKVANR